MHRVIFLSHSKNDVFGRTILAVGFLVKRGSSIGLLTVHVANHYVIYLLLLQLFLQIRFLHAYYSIHQCCIAYNININALVWICIRGGGVNISYEASNAQSCDDPLGKGARRFELGLWD